MQPNAAYRVRPSLLRIAATISWLFIPLPSLFSFHLISSHRSFSWKLLIASLCHRSLCHPISSQLISCLLSFFSSSHLIPFDVFSPFLSSSHLITTVLISSHVIWAFLTPSQLIWTLLFWAPLSSSPLFSCQVVSTHPISFHLSFLSQLFSTILSSSRRLTQSRPRRRAHGSKSSAED